VRSIWITYTASAAATSRFTLQRKTGGRVVRRRCVTPTRHNRAAPACTRYVNVVAFTHRDRVGTNRLRLTAHVRAAKLVPGLYRLRAVLTDAAGRRHTFYALLRVVGRRHTPATRSTR
jgi:hypothetical protein